MVDVGSAVAYLLLDKKGFSNGLKSAGSELNTFKDKTSTAVDKFTAVGSSLTSVGMGMSKAVTLPLIGAGAALGAMGIQFEDAMAKVSTIADTTQVPLSELETAIMKLSDETGIAAADIADNVYNAISAGQETGDAVAFVENATKLATAGFTDSAAALDVLTTTLNAYGLESEEVSRVSDVLITTQNLGKTTVDELASSMGKIIPTAQANGVSVEELGASYATLTANGIATAESTTYLNSMMNELGKSGTVASDILREETGKSFAELMDSGMSLGDVLQVIQDSADDSGLAMADMFGSAEAGKAAMSLLSGGVDGYNAAVEEMLNSTGATDEAFEKMQTTSMKLRIAWNKIKNVAIDFGGVLLDTLMPIIDSVVDKISQVTEWLRNLDETQKQTIIKIAGVVAAIGPALVIIGKLVSGVGGLITKFSSMGTFLTKIPALLGALSAPVAIVIGLIAALVLAFTTNFGGLRDKLMPIFETIGEMWQNLVTSIQAFWDEYGEAIMAKIEAAFSIIAEVIARALEVVVQAIQTTVNIVIAIIEVFRAVWESNFLNIQGIFTAVWGIIQTVFETVINLIMDIFNIFSAAFSGDWEGLWEAVKTFFSDIWEGVVALLGSFLNLIVQIIIGIGSGLLSAAKTAFGKIKEGFEFIWNTIKEWFGNAINFVVETVAGIGSDLYDAGVSIFTSLWEGLKSVWTGISEWFSNRLQDIKDFFTSVGNSQSSASTYNGGPRASGLDYVPRDMQVTVHEGEAILTAQQNRNRTSSGGGDTYNFYSPQALTETKAAQEFSRVKKELALGFI